MADELLRALNGSPAGPVSVLGRGAEELARRLEAGGMVGDPPTAANAHIMADTTRASLQADVLLLAGNEDWPDARLPGRQVIQLRWSQPVGDHPHPSPLTPAGEVTAWHTSGAVLLPITHPYEQTGTVTNMEGRVQ